MSTRRYPGAKPFTKDQQAIFYGREEDIERLHRMISLESLSVLYGKSGYGKSSLINAGLVPKLDQDSNNLPILIRFQAWTKNSLESPLDRIRTLLKELPSNRTALDKLSPKENSLWYLAKAYQYAHPDRRLILLFDQFEELFSYPKAQIQKFKEQLAELVRGQLPDRYDELLDIAADREEAPLTEEEEEQLYSPLNVRINFSIRSDRMHLLDQLSDYLPNVLQNNLELKALKEEDAVKALVFPAQMPGDFDANSFSYTDAATKKIMHFLKNKEDGLVEAIQLQILCTSFEDKAIQENIQNFDIDTIGDLDAIIKNFYHDQLAKIENEHDQKAAARLLEDGLLDKDRKERLTLHESQIRLLFRVKSDLLNQLVDNNLLRREPDRRIGYTYELSHDTLIAPALAAREIREQEEAEKQRLLQEKELKEERRKRRNTYAFAVFATMLAIFASLATFVAWDQQRIAEQNLAEAKREKDRADRLSSQATQQLAITQIARDSAKAQKERAELETLRADSLLDVAQNQEALALLEAAKGNKLKETLSGGNVYKYLKDQGTDFYNNGEYRNALTYWANAQFFLDTAIHENPLIISGLIRKAKLGTLAEDDFQNGRLTNAKKRYRQLKADNYLNKEPIEKRLAQIDTSLAIWKRTIGDQKLDTIQVLELKGDMASIPQEIVKLKKLDQLIIFSNKGDEIYLKSVPKYLKSLTLKFIDFAELPDISTLNKLKSLEVASASRIRFTNLAELLPKSLEYFQISGNNSLESLPKLNGLSNLSSLFIRVNDNLRSLPELDYLSNLSSLEISGNNSLESLPKLNGLSNLSSLVIRVNDNLRSLPSLDSLSSLSNLEIRGNENLKSLPSLEGLSGLSSLEIRGNENLESLPSLESLSSLSSLVIRVNDNLRSLPELDYLSNLSSLEISGNNSLESLPKLNGLSSLSNLEISSNDRLKSLPSLEGLSSLSSLEIRKNESLENLPILDGLSSLSSLEIIDNYNLSSLPSLEGLSNLNSLVIIGILRLESLPSLAGLSSLNNLEISSNDRLKSLPSLEGLSSLSSLEIRKNESLENLPSLDGLSSLSSLEIIDNYSLSSLPSLEGLSNLNSLVIIGISSLENLPSLDGLSSLSSLEIKGNNRLESLPSLEGLSNLSSLKIIDNYSLSSLPSLNGLSSLSNLEIIDNDKLSNLPILEGLSSLSSLKIINNFQLENLPSLKGLSGLRSLEIKGNNRLESLPSLEGLSNLSSLMISYNRDLQSPPILPNQMDSLNFIRIKGYNTNYIQPIKSLPTNIGNYSSLKEIDVSYMELTDLPSSFENLKDNLKELNLRYNPMSEETVEKWRRLLPNTKVIF